MGFAETMKGLALPLAMLGAGLDRSGRSNPMNVVHAYGAGQGLKQQQDTSTAMQIMLQNDDPQAALAEIQNQGLQVSPQILNNIWQNTQAQKAANQKFQQDMYMKQFDESLLRGRPVTMSPGQVRMGPDGKPVASVPEAPPTSFREFGYAQKNPQYGEFLKGKQSGMSLEFGPDGQIRAIRQGPGAQVGGLTKPTQGKVQADLLKGNETLARVMEISQKYQPVFQTYVGKLNMGMLAQKAKMGKQLDPAEEQQLRQFADSRAAAFDLLNSELNRLSGAAVSEHEMKRLTKNLPSPGTGLFDGDDPITFKSKLDRIQTQIKMSIARLNYIDKHGLTPIQAVPTGKDHPISLDRVPQLIDQRGKQLERQYQAQGVPPGEIKQRVINTLSDEFGIRFN
jgi:hypothetical protein